MRETLHRCAGRSRSKTLAKAACCLVLLLAGCETKTGPSTTPTSLPVSVTGPRTIEQIRDLMRKSSCATYSFKDRGKPYLGYLQGMALSFARSDCELRDGEDRVAPMIGKASGPASEDALTHYGVSVDDQATRLRLAYWVLIGLGMRESNGRHWVGYDSTSSNTSANTAEAGPFQASYDSIYGHEELKRLIEFYVASPEFCDRGAWSQGVPKGASKSWGSGPGYQFQTLSKECPAFAAQYAAALIRVRRKHFGPINRKEVELVPGCYRALMDIRDYLDKDGVCRAVLTEKTP